MPFFRQERGQGGRGLSTGWGGVDSDYAGEGNNLAREGKIEGKIAREELGGGRKLEEPGS